MNTPLSVKQLLIFERKSGVRNCGGGVVSFAFPELISRIMQFFLNFSLV